MLSLSKKFFNETNYLSNGYKTAFNPTKNKLSFYKTDKHLTDLEQITKHVNELQKPIFSEITPYRNCHKKLKAINQLFDPEKGINLESFNENFKPTAAELKEQIWAVHATKILPKDTLKPVIGDFLTKEIIPGISNTIHFSLGELVRSHSGISWEERPFAIITPLGSIIDQAVNIFAYDTIITGSWELKKETIVLVPEETDISEIQDKPFKVVSYKSSKTNLRTAIDEIILKKNGLNFQMAENSVLVGSKALLDESININEQSFFESLLKEKQGMLSFGDHTHSQIGDASALGLIRQLSIPLIDATNHPGWKFFYKPLIYVHYHLIKFFYNKIKDKYFSQEEQQNIEKLLLTQEEKIPNRQDIKDPLWPYLLPDAFSPMNQMEMHAFKTSYPSLFDGPQNEFEAAWALYRWCTIGYERGLKEGLDKLINMKIDLFIKEKPQDFYPLFTYRLFEILNNHNNKNSNRLKIVNFILNLDSFERYKDALRLYDNGSDLEKKIQESLLNFNLAQ